MTKAAAQSYPADDRFMRLVGSMEMKPRKPILVGDRVANKARRIVRERRRREVE